MSVEEKYNTPNSGCCGRPIQYAKEPQCNYTDACMQEYCCPELASIKETEPGCKNKAVIPSVTTESVEGITNLANCFVHVNDINTTFYIDDKHRPMIIWAGPVDIPGYDMEHNPEGFRDQIITDKEKGIAVVYDKSGKGFTFGIYESLNVEGAIDTAITNKLNEMAQDGTIADIITSYLKDAILGFDTVADMKIATNLIDGSYARTLGYHSVNDGGSSTYKIRTITNDDVIDGGSIIEMLNDDSLIAELIPGRQVTPNQFGAYGDGVHDDILPCRACHDYAIEKGIEMGGVRHSIYGLSEPLKLLLNGYDFNNAEFKPLNAMQEVIWYHPYRGTEDRYPLEYLKNIKVDCDGKANYGIYMDQGGHHSFVNNVIIYSPLDIGFYISYGSVRMIQCKIEQRDLTRQCIGLQTDGVDSEISFVTPKNCTTGIKVTNSGNTFTSCHPSMFEPDLMKGSIGFYIKAFTSLVNCVSDTYNYGIYLDYGSGFSCVNMHYIIVPEYYNVEHTPDATPYFLYTNNTAVGRTNGIYLAGCWMTEGTVYDDDYIHFTNFTKWQGSSIRRNNPKLNLTGFDSTLPLELHQDHTQFNISSYKTSAITGLNAANMTINGNNVVLYGTNLTLGAINSGTDTTIFTGLPAYLTPDSNRYFTCTTLGGVVCRSLYKTDGTIIIKPQSAVTAGDTLWINQSFLL